MRLCVNSYHPVSSHHGRGRKEAFENLSEKMSSLKQNN